MQRRQWIKTTRILVLIIGVVSSMTCFGGILLGAAQDNAKYWTEALFYSGLATACWLWVYETRRDELTVPTIFLIGIYSAVTGMALYNCAIWVMWIVGMTPTVSGIESGLLMKYWWLPPVMVVYSGFLKLILTVVKRSGENRQAGGLP